MKFSKYNNPAKKRARKPRKYSQAYVEERREEMYRLLAGAKTDAEKDAIIKAFNVTVNP